MSKAKLSKPVGSKTLKKSVKKGVDAAIKNMEGQLPNTTGKKVSGKPVVLKPPVVQKTREGMGGRRSKLDLSLVTSDMTAKQMAEILHCTVANLHHLKAKGVLTYAAGKRGWPVGRSRKA